MKLHPVRVTIKNYQSIADLDIEIAGFTCITGPTNIGKSSILRAISGALLNKPVTNLVRTGSKSCSVRISSEADGKPWGFLWEKAEKGLNRYCIDGRPEKLENVGQKPPEPIGKFGFGAVRIGDREMHPWYASQWSPLFLLDEGGPTITQFISEISGLNVLQDAISLGLKGKRKSLEDLKSAEAEVEQCESNLAKVGNLPELETIVKELEHQHDSINEYGDKVTRAKELLESISKLSVLVDVLGPVGAVSIPHNGMADQVANTLEMKSRLRRLEEAARAIIALRGTKMLFLPDVPAKEHEAWLRIKKYSGLRQLKQTVQTLEAIGEIDLPQPPDSCDIARVAAAKVLHKSLSGLRHSVNTLDAEASVPPDPNLSSQLSGVSKAKAAMAEMLQLQREVAELKVQQKQTDKDLDSVLADLSSIPSCPTCSRPVACKPHDHA